MLVEARGTKDAESSHDGEARSVDDSPTRKLALSAEPGTPAADGATDDDVDALFTTWLDMVKLEAEP